MKLFFQVLAGGIFMWIFILTFFNSNSTLAPVYSQEESNLNLDTPSTVPLPEPTPVITEAPTFSTEPEIITPEPEPTYAPPPPPITTYTPPPITWTPEPPVQTYVAPPVTTYNPPPVYSRYYKNCKAVWNDIGGPIYYGDPGFGSHLDRDGDGIGCETRPNY